MGGSGFDVFSFLVGVNVGAMAVLLFLVAVLALVIVWPLDRRVRVDAMAEPFGDQPRVPS